MSTLKERNAERLRKSIAGEKADGHAVFNYYTYPFFHAVTKVPLNEYFHNPKVMFDAQLEALELLDGCGNFAPDAGAVAECSALGGKVRFDEHGYISVAPAEIEELDDVLAIKPGDPYGNNYMRIALEQLEYMVEHCPAGYGESCMINPKSLIEMLESSYDGIWITDGNGRILFANSANASLLGVTKEDLMGKSTEELLEKKIFSDSVCLEAIEQKRQTSKVCYNYNTQLTVLATATPIFGENGEVRYIFNNVRDITSLNNMQASLRDKEEIIRRQNKQLEDMKIRLGVGTIIANSESFRKVVELAQRVATFDGATVLILGESGTGKELVSELLVNNSPRKDMPYLQVNCGAIPENLIESELFGYEKGAFTGADNRGHKGLFEAANGGTVFLDEIGDLPLHMQVKLLRVLQQRKVTRVGGTEPIDINVRVIAATNKNLEQMVREGQFREDLYYRLNVVSVQIPPLRERKEDIVPLLNHFLTVVNQKYHTQKTIFSDTIDAFENYPWPGNVRELENVLENLVITTPGDEIRRENLPKKFWSENGEPAAVGMREILPLKVTVERVELAAIQHAIDQCGSVRKAAAALGVDPSTIVRKMQGHKEK